MAETAGTKRVDDMSIERYWTQLSEIERKFYAYKQDLENVLAAVSSNVHHTVITKGEIANPTPYCYERMGHRLKGKILQAPISSDDCMRYHYDHENRIIMVEQYSVFFNRFRVQEIYLYNDLAERLVLSAECLMLLSVFDNAFSNTRLCLTFAGRNGHIVEEFIYDGELLEEIRISRDYSPYDRSISRYQNDLERHRCIYEGQTLIQIERTCYNGYKELVYTTKKPNFNRIKESIYSDLKNIIANYQKDFVSFGIEGFLDQQQPMLCVCFTEDQNPSDLIADWNAKMHDVWVYDWQLDDSQEKKCVKIIAEVIVELTDEGLLKEKQIYFHQNQICVISRYSGAKSVFGKANIKVR